MDTSARLSVNCIGPSTVAVLAHRDGQVRPLLFEAGASSLTSGVFLAQDGTASCGSDAVSQASNSTGVYFADPLRLLGGEAALSPGQGVDPVDVLAALLRHVRDQASQVDGQPVSKAAIVTPDGWGPRRRRMLRHAAHRAGFTSIELVDAASALLHHKKLSSPRSGPGHHDTMVVYRVAGDIAEAVVVVRNGPGWERVAAHDRDIRGLDQAGVVDQVVNLVNSAVGSADIEPAGIAAVIGQAPPTHVPAIAAGLRRIGIVAASHSASDLEVAYGALASRPTSAAGPATQRGGLARHITATAVPLAGAPVLLTLLLNTGMHFPPRSFIPPLPYESPGYLYTLWPTWSMVALLVLLGAVAATLLAADLRARRPQPLHEADRRRFLARGLHISAAAGVAAGVVASMLGRNTYSLVPSWYFFLWTTGPALVLAAVIVLIAYLIRHGYLSAVKWQIWLRFPNLAIILMTAGMLTLQVWLYMTYSMHSYKYYPGLAPQIGELGAIAIALGGAAIALQRFQNLVIASPVVIGLVMLTNSYTNDAAITGLAATAIVAWWLVRIRPAPAFSDPDHPATVLARSYEAGTPPSDEPEADRSKVVRGAVA